MNNLGILTAIVSLVTVVLAVLILVKVSKKDKGGNSSMRSMGMRLRAVGNCDMNATEYCANKSSCTSLPGDKIQCVACDSYDGAGCVPAGDPNDPTACPCTACITPPSGYNNCVQIDG